MQVHFWSDVLQRLDARPASNPIARCVEQLLCSAEQRDYLLMGGLANNAREIAQVCGDPAGEATIKVFQAIAQFGLGRRASCNGLLRSAQSFFGRHPAAWARRNQGVTAVCLGLFYDLEAREESAFVQTYVSAAASLSLYFEARRNLQAACRALAESGNHVDYQLLEELLVWVAERIADKTPLVFVDGNRGVPIASLSPRGRTNDAFHVDLDEQGLPTSWQKL
jgi:hypothetical protein